MAVTSTDDVPTESVLEIVERVAGLTAEDKVQWTLLWRSALEALARAPSPRGESQASFGRPRLPPAIPRNKMPPIAPRSRSALNDKGDASPKKNVVAQRQQQAVDLYRKTAGLPRLGPRSASDESPKRRRRPWRDVKLPRPKPRGPTTGRIDEPVVLQGLLDNVARHKKERLLSMLVKIEKDLGASR